MAEAQVVIGGPYVLVATLIGGVVTADEAERVERVGVGVDGGVFGGFGADHDAAASGQGGTVGKSERLGDGTIQGC